MNTFNLYVDDQQQNIFRGNFFLPSSEEIVNQTSIKMNDPYWGDSETYPIEESYKATIRLQASDYLTTSSHVYIRPYLKAYISNIASLSLAIVSFVSLIM